MKKQVRLTDRHPLSQKLEKVFDLMHELGIRFDFDYGKVVLRDGSDTVYELRDLEDSGRWPEPVHELPPATEYKVTYEKEIPDEPVKET